MNVDFTTPYNILIGGIPGGMLTFMTVLGAALVVWGIGQWIWRKRTGGGGLSGFPLMWIIIGALLAGPAVTGRVLMMLAQVIVSVLLSLVELIAGWF